MSLEKFTQTILPAIEKTLQEILTLTQQIQWQGLHAMLSYHLGWEGTGAGPEARGKRIRPLLLLLTHEAAGGNWRHVLPAAAAIELIHNFSLIHDDIEDNSPLRHGRPTVWTEWGIPQAINAGDAMFILAHLAVFRIEKYCSKKITLQAAEILQQTCLHLTQGQYLDIAFERQHDLTLEAYWAMVEGKTGALIAAATQVGALTARAQPETCQQYREFGRSLGLAFQALDDWLGIWGDAALTGKSADSDLLAGKNSLPVVYGLNQRGPFYQRWIQGPITSDEVPALAKQLESEGSASYTQEAADRLTRQALEALEHAAPQGAAGEALYALALRLLQRKQ